MGLNSYKGSIRLGAGLTPSGTGYPLMQACDIQVDEDGNTLADYIESGIADGEDGKDGADGVGISKIEKTNTNGNTDTYTITLTNGNSYNFTVTNGVDGKDGVDGANGADGKDGANGVDGKDGEDGKTPQKGVDYFTEAEIESIAAKAAGKVNNFVAGVVVSTGYMSYMSEIVNAIQAVGGDLTKLTIVTLTGYVTRNIAVQFNHYGGNTYRVDCQDLTYMCSIYNPQNDNVINVSSTRIGDFLEGGTPSNGKFFSVVNGTPTWVDLPVAEDIEITIAEEITFNE